MSEWVFKSGAKVKALTFTDAVTKLSKCKFSTFWAMEEEPGEWIILFEPDIEMKIHGAENSFEASRRAISLISTETGREFVDVKPVPKKLKKKCCSIFSRQCYAEQLFG